MNKVVDKERKEKLIKNPENEDSFYNFLLAYDLTNVENKVWRTVLLRC